ncbi:LytR/AlgR family response regulator transcription factor [Carboxydothermus pertinax]|uniref:Stage 0 sporulation protein A homolog n=1 Tax=Carboxydothermus pertinax TaxID=870242 RepID=A0A1L8CYP1_9THEO|nr:LytTR family DNA-binding domain-containing protein [Carboxydothermus pertinax]GAV24056.1 DNA-binding response regulator [Carboxydothermus pertinax]
MLKVIIGEDDPAMRLVLRRVLEGIFGIEVIGEAGNGRQLVSLVEEFKPDVVFVDVDLPEMNGVEAAREIFDIDPKIFIIFATAYDSYTHEAFEVYAFDYLIKPFKLERIKQTMKRISELKGERDKSGIVERLMTPPVGENRENKNLKLLVYSNDKCTVINVHEIILITRFDRKTVIHTARGNFTTNETLKQLEERIKSEKLFRCHKSYMINVDMITEIVPWGNRSYLIKLANVKETAIITQEKLKEFQEKYCL